MRDFKRIAIMGAGGMGTLLGARFAQEGVQADLIDVNRAHVQALNEKGAAVCGTLNFTVPVRALTPEEMTGEYDLVFFIIKQPFNDSALEALKDHVAPDGIVCTFQNGLPEPAIEAVFGRERTLGCAVTWTASLKAPGVSRAASEPENWHCTLGRTDGKLTEGCYAVQRVLQKICPAEVAGNLTGIRWSKLLVNCTFSGVGAALGCSFGAILDEPEALRCAQYVAKELLDVTAALGIELPPLGRDENFRTVMDFRTEAERESTNWIYEKLWRPSGEAESSMLQDLRRGTPSEIDHINGILSRMGRQAGVPTPVCDRVIQLVREAEAAKTVPNLAENLPRLSEAIPVQKDGFRISNIIKH